MSENYQKETGKQGLCTHIHEKTPEPLMRNGCFFWLVEALPQALSEHEMFWVTLFGAVATQFFESL